MFRMFPDYFYKHYDYCGANYYNEKYTAFYYGGINGGFSIRNKDAMIECLQKIAWNDIHEYRKNMKIKYDEKNYSNTNSYEIDAKNEDIFFTYACEILKKKVPDTVHRKLLAIEECDMKFTTCVYQGWDKGYHDKECATLLLKNSDFYNKYINTIAD